VFRTIYQSNETCNKLDKRRPNKWWFWRIN
jgi:hypothetical protein